MSKQRYVDTRIWEDNWFSNLDQIEQLVFLYFLTNPTTNIVGVYELSKATISRAVGLEILTLNTILERFERDKKVFYIDGWVVLPNFIKHQNYNSPKIKKGIEIELERIPDKVKTYINIPYVYGIDTPSHSNTNSNIIKLKKDTEETSSSKETPLIIKEFESLNPAVKRMYGNKTQRAACEFLVKSYSFERVISTIKTVLPKTNCLPYFPNITTPLQLQDNWSKLENAVRKYQTENIKNKGNVIW